MEEVYKYTGMIVFWAVLSIGSILTLAFILGAFWGFNERYDTILFQIWEFIKVKYRFTVNKDEYEIDHLLDLKYCLTEGRFKNKIFRRAYLRDIEKLLNYKQLKSN